MAVLDQLKVGDILLFEGEDDLLDQTIMLLTRSNVTHAALYCGNGVLVDAGLSGVGAHVLRDDPLGRKAFVRRLAASIPLDPVVRSAGGYVAEVDPYDKPGLALLALLLVYEKFIPSDATQKVMAWLLKRVVEYLEKWNGSRARPVTCSQFVFRCFEDASAPIHLEIEDGTVQVAAASRAPASLIDRVAIHRASSSDEPLQPEDPQAHALSDEVLVGMLIESLQADAVAVVDAGNTPLREDLARAVHSLGGALLKTIRGIRSPEKGTLFLVEQRASFASPADMLRRCPDLADAGSLTISREAKNTTMPGR